MTKMKAGLPERGGSAFFNLPFEKFPLGGFSRNRTDFSTEAVYLMDPLTEEHGMVVGSIRLIISYTRSYRKRTCTTAYDDFPKARRLLKSGLRHRSDNQNFGVDKVGLNQVDMAEAIYALQKVTGI